MLKIKYHKIFKYLSSIYIHIPFCKQSCSYCNFHFSTSQINRSSLISSICKEIRLSHGYLKSKKLNTIYFGGGTPSILEKKDLENIFNTIRALYSVENDAEITIECNPEDMSKERLKFLYVLGINRLSIGIQSFKNEDLIMMNRSHDSEQAIKAVNNAKSSGFKNISIDLIFSLPYQTANEWNTNLDIAFELGVQHISSYSLTIKEKTKLSTLIKRGEIDELNEITSWEQYETLLNRCSQQGFINYEISNFGKKGFFSKHNQCYWSGNEYLGIGPSAHSYNQKSRQWNISSNTQYIKSLLNQKIPFEIEHLTKSQKYNEYILTSLRTNSGIDIEFVKLNFQKRYHETLIKSMIRWIDTKHLIRRNNIITLSNKGKFISDNIFSDMLIV